MARRDSYMPERWSCWKTSHLAEDTLLSWATNPDSYSSLADYAEPCRIPYQYLGTTTTFAALHESGCGRYCCKSPKLPGANFPAITRSDLKPPICVASISLGRSLMSLSSGDEVPHIFTRKSRLRPGKFLITGAKRVLQQNRHWAAPPGRQLSWRVLDGNRTIPGHWNSSEPRRSTPSMVRTSLLTHTHGA